PILGQQFYSNEDINRLIEEQIASRENLALKKPKEISGYLPSQNPSCPTQVDPNTEAIRQLLEILKHAKKILAKKPGPEREKADKICIDHFLNEVLKNMDNDPDSN
ncbi:42230_t:CDS:1, partial [Gigaspora margarita]